MREIGRAAAGAQSKGLAPWWSGRRTGAALAALLMAGSIASADEQVWLRGRPYVVDGRQMMLSGQDVRLAGIVVPVPGERCRIGGNVFDCGRLARAGLMDLLVGGEVQCRALAAGDHWCLAEGYDLAFGLIHAGWAVPTADAPARYHVKMRESQARRRGLWSAGTATEGETTIADWLRR